MAAGAVPGAVRLRAGGWMRAFLAGVALCAAGLLANAVLSEVDASNLWGMTYGSVATALMLGAAAIGVRRRTMRLGLGRARTWQQFHLYGGSLFLLLVLMHSSFRYPDGSLSQALFVLSLWVAASGWIGVLVQTWTPRVLAAGLDTEAVWERIPDLVRSAAERCDALSRESTATVRDFHVRSLAPRMAAPRFRFRYFLDLGSAFRELGREFDYLLTIVPESETRRVEEMRRIFRTKLELDAHHSLQLALRSWLWIHVPPSIALVVLVAIHVFVVFYY
jgi:hypothetical protein